MFLRGHNIFFSYDCVEHLKRLAEIIGADIKKIESEDTLLPDKKTQKEFSSVCLKFIKSYSGEHFKQAAYLRRALKNKKNLIAANKDVIDDLTGCGAGGWVVWFFQEAELLKYLMSPGIHLVAVLSGTNCHAFTVFRVGEKVVVNSNEFFYVYTEKIDNGFLVDFYGCKYNFKNSYVYTHISG